MPAPGNRLRTTIGRAVPAALLALASCGGILDTPPPQLGHVSLTVDTPAALPLNRIDYQIQHRNGYAVKGAIRFDDLTRTIAAHVRGLPVARAYEVTFSATSEDGEITCNARGGFDVSGGMTTAFSTMLGCTTRSGGPIGGARRGFCKLIKSSTLTPVATGLGGLLKLAVEVMPDVDLDDVTYAWSAERGGTFADATAASTTWKCEALGEHLITLRVRTSMCADRHLITARCVELPCGNGRLDPGESCDDGNRADGDACPADCQLPRCGNGKLEPGETCEPPGTATCDFKCRRLDGCGNGTVEPGEQCDDANLVAGDGCSDTCKLEATCGNGVIEPGEDCEPPAVGTCNVLCKTGPQL